MIAGVYPASVTPFDAKGGIDYAAVAKLTAWFRTGGCKGVVLAGTNGEGPSLSAVEKRDLVKTSVALAEGLDVILGVATPSLDEAVWLCKQTGAAGAKGVLLMPPGYFRDVSEEGIARWFEAVLDKSPVGVLIYNFPQRTGITLTPELMHRLSKHDRMVGLKDSSGNADNLASYADALSGSTKSLFVGDETLLVRALAAGWSGTISGAANLVPGWLSQIVSEWPRNRESAETKHELIMPALKEIRSCKQPAANKLILHELGVLPSADVRLPLESLAGEQVALALAKVRQLYR